MSKESVYLMEFRTEWKIGVHRVDQERRRLRASAECALVCLCLCMRSDGPYSPQTLDTDSVHVVQCSVVVSTCEGHPLQPLHCRTPR
jgi:hypothetical protein